jgi:transposase
VKKFLVRLTEAERDELLKICSKGKQSARKIRKANILLAADKNQLDEEIAQSLNVSFDTIERTRRRFVEGNLAFALNDCHRSGRPKLFDGIQEAALVALACTTPPNGRRVWTAELLAEHMIHLGVIEAISPESVRLILKKNDLKPWQKQEWCIPQINDEYVWRMEEILELYADPFDPKRPVVCFDETPYQLIEESRPSVPMHPGQPLRVDYEYVRKGTANLFMFLQPRGGWRHVKVTKQRKNEDFALCLVELVNNHFPDAERIRLVLDNLNTHSPARVYGILPPEEARKIVRKLDFQYTPKHASWLNMAEIEIAVLNKQCLHDRYIPSLEMLENEVYAWERHRNSMKAEVNWMFALDDARTKMGHLYPKLLQVVERHAEAPAKMVV